MISKQIIITNLESICNSYKKTIFVSTIKTVNISSGLGLGYANSGARYNSFKSIISTNLNTGGGGGSNDDYSQLSQLLTELNPIIYNYSIGDFEYLQAYLTELKYYDFSQRLYILRKDPAIYPEYENIRTSITRGLEGMKRGINLYYENKTLANELEISLQKSSILDDIELLKQYLLERGNTINLFPDIEVTSFAATLKPEISIYIKLYGFPPEGIFEVDKLAFSLNLAREDALLQLQ
jgi:hypothetical protein